MRGSSRNLLISYRAKRARRVIVFPEDAQRPLPAKCCLREESGSRDGATGSRGRPAAAAAAAESGTRRVGAHGEARSVSEQRTISTEAPKGCQKQYGEVCHELTATQSPLKDGQSALWVEENVARVF